jgi:hypothetical protein
VNGIVEGFKAGKRSAADFADTFDELMQGAVTNALSMMADEKMRDWYNNFYELGKDGYTDEEIEQAKADYLKYIEQLGEDAKALEKATGVTIEEDSRREASKKGLESMSQDSATELNGKFTAQGLLLSDIKGEISLQTGIQSDMSTTLMEIRNYSSEVVGNMQTMKETSILIVEHLGAIRTNTARLEAIENGIKDINIFGLKLRNV